MQPLCSEDECERGEEGASGQRRNDLAVAVFDVVDHDKITGGREILSVHEIFPGFQPGMGQAMGADDLVAFLVDGGDPCREARQIFSIRICTWRALYQSGHHMESIFFANTAQCTSELIIFCQREA